MNSSNIFFKPYVGTFYNEGIDGKKVLVLGASFYCGMSQCIYYKDCTNENIKDSSPYDDICPYYDVALHNAPSTENGTAYSKFANSIAKHLTSIKIDFGILFHSQIIYSFSYLIGKHS